MSKLEPPRCHSCREELVLGAQGELNPWSCPNGHGLGFTLSESYERLQDDEIDQLWSAASGASARGVRCPFCSETMAVLTVEADADEIPEGDEGDGPTTHTAELDVCVRDQFIWFDPGELEVMPEDLPDPEPTAEQKAAFEQIRANFRTGMEEAWETRGDQKLTERMYDRVARHPKLHSAMDRVGDVIS